jgi:cytochrome c556
VFQPTKLLCACALGVLLFLGGPGHASAQGRGGDGAANGGGGGRGGAAPATPFSYRQGIMQQMQSNMMALTAIRNGQVGAPGHLLNRATILQQLAAMLPDAFPEGSPPEGSRALQALWDNPTERNAGIQALQQSVNALVDAARSANAEQVAAAQMSVNMSCNSCHMQFRGPPGGGAPGGN